MSGHSDELNGLQSASSGGFLSFTTGWLAGRRLAMAGALAAVAIVIGSPLASFASPSSGLAGAPLKTFLAPPQMASTSLAPEMAVLMNQGISPARAWRAIVVQNHVAKTHALHRIGAALAGAFAGVWFEPASASYHIGVTSNAMRRRVGRLLARAGLAHDVVETPVRWRWSALEATQSRWNRRLAKLLAGGEAVTGLEPKRNAVAITLSLAIPPRERAALEREVAIAGASAYVTAVAQSQLPTKQVAVVCSEAPFVSGAAWCGPTLTSGVGIRVTGLGTCTVGPLLVAGNETYMLTAGHCLGGATGRFGGQFFGQNAISVTSATALEPMTQKEIGNEGLYYLDNNNDVGEVKINRVRAPRSTFIGGLPEPLPAVMAEWGAANPANPHIVNGEAGPAENAVNEPNCHEGQTSGERCGVIRQLDVTAGTVNHLVWDTACAEPGDSGGPFFFREAGTTHVLMQGTAVTGGVLGNCNGVTPETSTYEPFENVSTPGWGIRATFPRQRLLTGGNLRRLAAFNPATTQTFEGGVTVLVTSTETVKCTQEGSSGEVTGETTVGKVLVTLTGCHIKKNSEKSECPVNSVGASEGDIVTKPLKGEAGEVNLAGTASIAALLLEPETTKLVTELVSTKCSSAANLEGSVAGELAPVTNSHTVSQLSFAVSSGKQVIKAVTVMKTKQRKLKLELGGLEATAEAAPVLVFGKAAPLGDEFSGKQEFWSGREILSSSAEQLKCTQEGNTGRIDDESTQGKIVMTFTGCHAKKGTEECQIKSVGADEGEVVTKPLTGKFGESEEAAESALVLAAETKKGIAELASAKCSAATTIEGEIAGELGPTEAPQTLGQLIFPVSSGEDQIKMVAGKAVKFELAGHEADDESAIPLVYGKAVEIE